ncbi:MAG: MG2 domain-containing protein [Prevotella sp.]|nr:MG2 domain-containing protein [Prevotella sp.]
MLKASLPDISIKGEVEPDSLAPLVVRYAAEAEAAEDKALRAVWFATLGSICRTGFAGLDMPDEERQQTAKEYFAKALADPALLARTRAKTFSPLAVEGNTSLIFGSDLLHLIAFEAEDYQVMTDYYTAAGNRAAACLASLYKLRSERPGYEEPKKSTYLARLDSLIHEYSDLDAAGEVAIEHFNVMDASPDVSAREKVEFIDYALIRWPGWERMAVLKNARRRITLPSFHVSIDRTVAIPGREITVDVTSVINLQSLTMNVYRVDINGDETYDPNNADDYKALSLKKSEKPVATDRRVWYGLPEYREIRDTLTIAPLPVGVYLVEFSAEGSGVPTERVMLNITNLRLIDMGLTEGRMRLIAVDATTGAPLPGADIHIKFRDWKDGRRVEDERTLRTESDGEIVYSSTLPPAEYRLTTADDKAFPWQSISRRTYLASSKKEETLRTVLKTYTDRSVYRPGQTVKASVLAYTAYDQEHWEVRGGADVTFVLTDAKGKEYGSQAVVTDEWGVAAAELALPSDAPTGYFRLKTSMAAGTSNSVSFRVEEYKRPTFTVDIDPLDKPYKDGDTILVSGRTTAYSGVPVGNATVRYKVRTEESYWWRVSERSGSETGSGVTTTASDGVFTVKVPVCFPPGTKKGSRFARVVLSVEATSASGETHAAQSSYLISDRATYFGLDGFEERQCRERAEAFSFIYTNSAGDKLDETVSYAIDGGEAVSVPTNTPAELTLNGLFSGLHTLKATCASDTLETKFIVFSLDDTSVPVDTAAWYYSTCGGQSRYQMKAGEAEYIQFGSNRTGQTVFFTVLTADSVLESGRVTINNELRLRKVEYKEEWGDGVAIRYSWVCGGGLYTFSESLSRPVKDCSLNIELNTFRDRLVPGEPEEWTFTVSRSDGRPARAQIMAVMYDKSLDAIYPHSWQLNHTPYYTAPVVYQGAAYNRGAKHLYGEQGIRYSSVPALLFWRFDLPAFTESVLYGYDFASTPLSARSRGIETALYSGGEADDSEETFAPESVSIRENLEETAFFMPQITTDKSGSAKIKFTLPESLTTWRVLSLAHDKEMNTGALQRELSAQKTLTIQPNMPRFIREGDEAQLSAVVTNTSGETCDVRATVTLIDPAADASVFEASAACVVKAESNASVTFFLPSDLAANVYTCVVKAETDGLSDGEQNLLPVLSASADVVSTRAFTQTAPGEKTIDLAPLYGEGATNETLTAEYTDNPAWLLLDALPVVSTPDDDNAISLAAALYAARLTEKITEQLPEGTLAGHEQTVSADRIAVQLKSLQNADGSFSWYKGMPPSDYVSLFVAETLARGKHTHLPMTDEAVLERTMEYLDSRVADDVNAMRRAEKDSLETMPSEETMHYLYAQTLIGDTLASPSSGCTRREKQASHSFARTLTGTAKDNARYLLRCLKGHSRDLTIYGKARMAYIFSAHPELTDTGEAALLLESVRQYITTDETSGSYFPTSKARYSWRDYKIPTQVAAIEAFQTLAPDSTELIGGLQQWLLGEKRTQVWDTPVNSAEAVYAFFDGCQGFAFGALEAASNPERLGTPTRLFLDGKEIKNDGQRTGSAKFSRTLTGRFGEFKATKTTANTSWGAVKINYSQPLEDIRSDGEALSIRREILDAEGGELSDYPTAGQRVRVRITVVSARDLDFVEITDNRPACLEPANQLSGYSSGGYVRCLDTKTVVSFDKLPKGKHVVETEYYVDREGSYRSGIATVACAYAPEYQGREASYTLEVK